MPPVRTWIVALGIASAAGLRAYFLPEDDTSTLYIYDVNAK